MILVKIVLRGPCFLNRLIVKNTEATYYSSFGEDIFTQQAIIIQ